LKPTWFRQGQDPENGANLVGAGEHRSKRPIGRWVLLGILLVASLVIGYTIYAFFPRFAELTNYGYLGVFLLTLICSATIFFPTPGFIIVFAMVVSPAFSWPLVALAAAVGGGLGESTAYIAGYGGNVIIVPEQWKRYRRWEDWTRHYGGIAIFVFSLAPFLPFDLAGIVAGAMRYPFWKFLLATLAGRLVRSFSECYLVYLGWITWPTVREFLATLDWWGWLLGGLFAVAVVGGVVAIVWWRKRVSSRRKLADLQEETGDQL